MPAIDLNCDMGESFGRYNLGLDDQVMPFITSANIACGFHAGDPCVMFRTIGMAAAHGVGIGAHPGLPDLVGFGRRRLECSPEDVRLDILYQIGALQALAKSQGTGLTHVKPHGALYHMALESRDMAMAVAQAVAQSDPGLTLFTLAGPKGQIMAEVCQELGLSLAREAFPDRAYTPEGTLAPRHIPGAVIQDPDQAAQRAVLMARDQQVQTLEGQVISLQADTLCVHGDSQAALQLVRTIKSRLEDSGITLNRPGGRI